MVAAAAVAGAESNEKVTPQAAVTAVTMDASTGENYSIYWTQSTPRYNPRLEHLTGTRKSNNGIGRERKKKLRGGMGFRVGGS